MNELAMVVGYIALGMMAISLIWSTCELSCSRGIMRLILFGFGPEVLDGGRPEVAALIRNLRECGWSLVIAGRFAIGWNSPRWLNRHVLRRNG